MVFHSAWKASFTGLTPIRLSHLRAKYHSFGKAFSDTSSPNQLSHPPPPQYIFSLFPGLSLHCIDQVVTMYTHISIWCLSLLLDVSSMGLGLFLTTVFQCLAHSTWSVIFAEWIKCHEGQPWAIRLMKEERRNQETRLGYLSTVRFFTLSKNIVMTLTTNKSKTSP